MLISGESSRVPVRIYNQAEQLARDAGRIPKDLLNNEIPLRDTQHKIAVLMKLYAELYSEIGKIK